MPAIDFPISPTNGQTFTSNDKTWVYSTTLGAWSLQTQTLTGPTGPTGIGATGPTGPTGITGDWSTAQVINAQTGTTYTVLNSDKGKLVTLSNVSPISVTVNTSTALSPGQRVDFAHIGVGQVTFVASSVTINATPGLKTRDRYSAVTLICTASNVYLLVGDLSA